MMLEVAILDSSRFILLVRWERLEDHTEGFRRSAEYEPWKSLLHHYDDPFPEVERYVMVDRCSADPG